MKKALCYNELQGSRISRIVFGAKPVLAIMAICSLLSANVLAQEVSDEGEGDSSVGASETLTLKDALEADVETLNDLEDKDIDELSDDEEAALEQKTIDDIVAPNIDRRTIDTAKIDTENWEVGAYFGILNVEDFGSNNTYGLTLAYHVSDDIFAELQYSVSQTGATSFDELSGGSDLLTEDERELTHYHLSVGYQLHGEIFLTSKRAYNTNFFVIAGLGNTDFGGNSYFSGNFGAGLRFFVNDWLALRTEFRHYLFSHSLVGEKKRIQNLEGRTALSVYF